MPKIKTKQKSHPLLLPALVVAIIIFIVVGAFFYHYSLRVKAYGQVKLVYGKGYDKPTFTIVDNSKILPKVTSFNFGWYVRQEHFARSFVVHRSHTEGPSGKDEYWFYNSALKRTTLSVPASFTKTMGDDPIYLPSINKAIFYYDVNNDRQDYRLVAYDLASGKSDILFDASSEYKGNGAGVWMPYYDKDGFIYLNVLRVTLNGKYYNGVIKYDVLHNKIVKVYDHKTLGYGDGSISPDGKRVAMLDGVLDKVTKDRFHYTLNILDLSSEKIVKSIAFGDAGMDDRYFFWSPDGQKLAFEVRSDSDKMYHIYYMNLNDGQKHEVFSILSNFSPEIVGWLNSDSFVYVNRLEINVKPGYSETDYVYSIATDKTEELDPHYGTLEQIIH